MPINETLQNIFYALAIIGIAFGVYKYFKNPQVSLDKKQALDKQEVEDKASILAEQFKWEHNTNERRFSDLSVTASTNATLAQNHIHSIDVKVDGLMLLVNQMGKDVVELRTIINERIPRKDI